jgi:hypothetical protein
MVKLRCRAFVNWPNVPVVLSSGYDVSEISDHTKTPSFAIFLQKAYATKQLLQVLKKVVIRFRPGAIAIDQVSGEYRAGGLRTFSKGFRYEGRHYASLSAIATEATGTRWNGWAFFGLVRPESHRGKGARRAKK